MSTVRDLITKSFKIAHIFGQGEPVPNEDANDALDKLNGLIEQANISKLFALYQTEIVFSLVANQLSYTIGPASSTPDVTAVRPVEILNAFSRRSGIDLPVTVTHQKEDYDRIQLKTAGVAGWEQFAYYQASYPAGTLYIYQKPIDTSTAMHLTVSAQLTAFSALSDTVTVPPGYFAWLQYKLASRLCPDYGLVFSQDNKEILIEVESSLERNNIKPFPISINDTGVLGQSGGAYNVYSDQVSR